MSGGSDAPGPGGTPEDAVSAPAEANDALRLALLPRNDFGLGERLRARFGDRLAFTPEVGAVAWEGRVWATDHRGDAAAARMAHETAALIRGEEAEAFKAWLTAKAREEDGEDAGDDAGSGAEGGKQKLRIGKAMESFHKFANGAGNAAKTSAMLAQARPYLTTEIASFDPDRFRLTVENGTLEFDWSAEPVFAAYDEAGADVGGLAVTAVRPDGPSVELGAWRLRHVGDHMFEVWAPGDQTPDVFEQRELSAGVFRGGQLLKLQPWRLGVRMVPHDPKHRITRMAAARWNPRAKAPLWEKHLETVLPDPGVRDFFQRCMGYGMTGSIESQCFLFVQGKGADGKSTTFRVIDHVLGSYAHICDPRSWLEVKQRSAAEASPDMAAMAGDTRLLYCEEPPKGARLNEALIKAASGGLRMKARHLNENLFEFEPRFLLCMAFNDRPRITGGDDGFWRRMRLVLFPRQFTKEEQLAAGDMFEKLIPEADGILNWLIEGLAKWRRFGLAPDEAQQALINQWRGNANPFSDWWRTRVEAAPGVRTINKEMFEDYLAYCEAEGLTDRERLGARQFSSQLDSLQIGTVLIRGKLARVGVKLRDKAEFVGEDDPFGGSGGGGAS